MPVSIPSEDVVLRSGDTVDPFELLGCSYSPQKGTLCEYQNVGLPVVNVKALKEVHPDYVRYFPLKSVKTLVKAFSSSQSYEEHIKKTLSVSGSISLKLPFFTAGANATFDRFFSKDLTSLNEETLGLASVEVERGRHQMFDHTQVMREVKRSYLNPIFVDQLYNAPFEETFRQKMGPYVLTHFTTGGRAEVFYYGKTNKVTTASEREKKLQGAMNASLSIAGYGGNIQASVNSIDKASYKKDYHYSEIQVGSHIVGGSVSSVVSPAKDLNDIKISFDSWMASMNDKKNHTLSGIAMDGLQPVHHFIPEANFRWQIENEAFNSGFYTPRIEILVSSWIAQEKFIPNAYNMIDGIMKYAIEVRLDTRHGVYVYLSPRRKDPKEAWIVSEKSALDRAIKDHVKRLKAHYDIDIVQRNIDFSTNFSHFFPLDRMRKGEVGINFKGLDESKMQKWTHPTYGIKYLLYNDGKGKRYAYSIQRDAMLDTYGIRKLYNNAPAVASSEEIMDLSDYVIVGL